MRRYGIFAAANVGQNAVLSAVLARGDLTMAMGVAMYGLWLAVMDMEADMGWPLARLMLLVTLLPTLGMDMSG